MEFNHNLVITLVSALGLVTLLKPCLSLGRWVWVIFFRPPKDLKRRYGSWALVTGATDGIGRTLALELAFNGLSLVLLGRNPAKLRATADEIARRHAAVGVRTVALDLAAAGGEEIRDAVERETRGLDLGIVVNNAGVAYPYAKFFDEVGSELLTEIIRVNIEAVTWITMAVLPRMLEKKRGAIINIGSASASIFPSFPLYTVYAASKAYISMFSKSISVEYKQSGIDIQCQVPVTVATKMTKVKPHSFLIASPETYSKASVRSVGFESLCAPYWSHSVQWFLTNALPESIIDRCIYAYFLGMNKRGKIKDLKKKKDLVSTMSTKL